MIGLIFTALNFFVFTLLCFFIARVAPNGKFLCLDYSSLPGVLTPRVLSSRENWIIGHKAVATGFMALGVYFGLVGVINLAVVCKYPDWASTAYGLSMAIGLFLFALLVFFGDRAVLKHQLRHGDGCTG